MTDEELAARLKRLAPVVIPRGPLLEEAADRILSLSAHNALIRASLAQAEREAEKPAASSGPVSELARRVAEIAQSHIGSQRPGTDEPEERDYWDMCQRVIDAPAASEVGIPTSEPVAWAKENGAVTFDAFRASCWKSNADKVVALYAAPQPDRVAALEAEVERLRGLIAAAPDLLEVAERILAPDLIDYLPAEYVAKVRAAIAKATGKETPDA